MNMQPQRFGIRSHHGLSDLFDSHRSDPTYQSISSRPSSLSVNVASFSNRAYSDFSFNAGSVWPPSSAGNYPSNGFSRNADMHSNSSGGYVTYEQVHQPPRQTESPFTCKRLTLIGCIIIIVLLIGGLATTTTSLLNQPNVSELQGEQGQQGKTTSTPTDFTTVTGNPSTREELTIHANVSEATSETTGLTTSSNVPNSTTKSVSTTTKLTSSSVTTLPPTTSLETTTSNPLPPSPSTTTRRLPTTTPPVTTCHPLPTTATTTATTTTTALLTTLISTTSQRTSEDPTTTSSTKTTTTTSQTTESCTRKCHTCTSKSVPLLCPANGTMTSNHHWHVADCPCDTTCYTEIRSTNDNAVHRGCTNEFPNWEILAKISMTCQKTGTSRVCFCLGDRCNTHDMTVF